MAWLLIVLIALVVIVFGLYVSMTAGRLDRLHQRIDTSSLGLDALLLRRSAVALELATSGVMDPASAIVLAEAAHGARTAGEQDPLERASAESELTQALVIALGEPEELELIREAVSGVDLLAELDDACRRVELGRRFLNDAVRAWVERSGETLRASRNLGRDDRWTEADRAIRLVDQNCCCGKGLTADIATPTFRKRAAGTPVPEIRLVADDV